MRLLRRALRGMGVCAECKKGNHGNCSDRHCWCCGS